MTQKIIACANGCTTGPDKKPRLTEPPSRICGHCEALLHAWLTKIPNDYGILPEFLEHGTTEQNPGSKLTKRPEAPAPMRLEVVDLLDTRLGRIWQGTAPAKDRRGVAGTLQSHVNRLRDERHLTEKHDDTDVAAACALLDRHRLWLSEQEWITDLFGDIRDLHRRLADAVGDYRRPHIGHCHIDTDAGPCRGKLYASKYGGVRCVRCGATWDAAHLRQLGLAQAAAQQDARA